MNILGYIITCMPLALVTVLVVGIVGVFVGMMFDVTNDRGGK